MNTSGRDTVRFRLHRPHAPFLSLVGSSQHLWIIPPEIVDDNTVAQRPVGSGAWIFDSYDSGESLRWRRNPQWHGGSRHDLPLTDRITASLDSTTDSILSGLGDGSLDYSQLSAPIYSAAVDAAPELGPDNWVFTPNTVPGGFFFNYSIPPWNDSRVRIALSKALDRDGILDATDPTGQGGWQSHLAQLRPWALDPKDLSAFGRRFEGADSGLNFHRNLAVARRLLDAAGYPGGIDAEVHATADYGAATNHLYETCAATATEAGFRFSFAFKEYASYIASTFRGNFPDDWDGESSHLAIGPFYGGAVDPNDILAAVYSRSSGRHNWGAAGRTWRGAADGLDTGGNAASWHHRASVRGGGPESDERLNDMIERQVEILDIGERMDYLADIQRYLATQMYIVPYVSGPGVYAFQPWMRYLDQDRVSMKSTYGQGQEYIAGLWIDRSIPGRAGGAEVDSDELTTVPLSTTDPDSYASWLSRSVGSASETLAQLPGIRVIWKWSDGRWIGYGTDERGRPIPGAVDFPLRFGEVVFLGD